jgi:hypothetical protein
MWTLKIASGTREHPTRKDVFAALLARLIEQNINSAWAHFEIVADDGWFKNLLRREELWVEVGLVDQNHLQLNLGYPKSRGSDAPGIPDKWQQESEGLWNVPATDLSELIAWIEAYLASAPGNSECHALGWLDGL